MTRTLQPGDRGIDCAFLPDTYAGIVKNGARFALRYSAGTQSAVLSKCTKVGEIGQAVQAGADFWANFELAESTPTEGAASGRRHGNADRLFWESRGLNPHAGVIVSWEPGNDKSQFTAVGRFLAAYKTGVGRPIGLYAGLPALLYFRKQGLIDATWLPMASSASGIDTSGARDQAEYAAILLKVAQDNGITLCQNRNRWYPQGGGNFGADEDIYVTAPKIPFSHLQAARVPVPPTPTPPPVIPVPPVTISTPGDRMILVRIQQDTVPTGTKATTAVLLFNGSGFAPVAAPAKLKDGSTLNNVNQLLAALGQKAVAWISFRQYQLLGGK